MARIGRTLTEGGGGRDVAVHTQAGPLLSFYARPKVEADVSETSDNDRSGAYTWQPLDLRSDPDEPEHRGDPGDLIEALRLLEEFLHRPAWHGDAACRGQGTAAWFPGKGESPRPAREVCAGCSVQAECLAAALEVGTAIDAGIWGGLSLQERRQLRRSTTVEAA